MVADETAALVGDKASEAAREMVAKYPAEARSRADELATRDVVVGGLVRVDTDQGKAGYVRAILPGAGIEVHIHGEPDGRADWWLPCQVAAVTEREHEALVCAARKVA